MASIPKNVLLPPLTTSRVVGSPDPPPPYRVARAYPNLKVPFPIMVARQPGSDRTLVISESGSYGPTRLMRFIDRENVDQLETLLSLDAVAYDLAFHPDFLHNGYLYVGMNGPSSRDPKKTQVVRYRLDPRPPYALDPKSATVIIERESNGHSRDDCGREHGLPRRGVQPVALTERESLRLSLHTKGAASAAPFDYRGVGEVGRSVYRRLGPAAESAKAARGRIEESGNAEDHRFADEVDVAIPEPQRGTDEH